MTLVERLELSELRAEALYDVAKRVLHATTVPEIAGAARDGLARLVPQARAEMATVDLARSVLTWLGAGRGAEPLTTLEDVPALRQGQVVLATDHTQAVVPVRDHGLLVAALRVSGPNGLDVRAIGLVREVATLVAEGLRRVRLAHDLRIANGKVHDAENRRSSFLSHVSHEIRTPLNAILGYLELIFDDADSLSFHDVVDDLRKVYRSSRHLLDLINDVLDLGKLEAGKLDITLTTVNLADLLEDLADVVGPLVAMGDNEWRVECDDEVWVLADPLRLRQVLLNLVGNAAKFTRDGEIAVEVHAKSEKHVEVEVIDTGVGIPAEALASLFEPFTQVQGVLQRGGTGLGLTIAQEFVRQMGGSIEVKSVVGRGSTFSVTMGRVLPELPEEVAAAGH